MSKYSLIEQLFSEPILYKGRSETIVYWFSGHRADNICNRASVLDISSNIYNRASVLDISSNIYNRASVFRHIF
mgnify:CR=1 FL=1